MTSAYIAYTLPHRRIVGAGEAESASEALADALAFQATHPNLESRRARLAVAECTPALLAAVEAAMDEGRAYSGPWHLADGKAGMSRPVIERVGSLVHGHLDRVQR